MASLQQAEDDAAMLDARKAADAESADLASRLQLREAAEERERRAALRDAEQASLALAQQLAADEPQLEQNESVSDEACASSHARSKARSFTSLRCTLPSCPVRTKLVALVQHAFRVLWPEPHVMMPQAGADVRIFFHDFIWLHHNKDYRSLAVCPPP